MTPEDYRAWRPKYDKYGREYPDNPEIQRRAALIGLAAEVGELLGLVQKGIRKNIEIDKDKVLDELGDVWWYFNKTLDAFYLSLDQVSDFNKKKLDERNK